MAAIYCEGDMKILFVCEGNMTRSQMAEAFYNQLTETHDAMSAGTLATLKPQAGERAQQVMREIGISMEGQYSKQLTPDMIDTADVVILFPTVATPKYATDSQKTQVWDVADPHYHHDEGMDFVRQVRDDIRGRVKKLAEELYDEN